MIIETIISARNEAGGDHIAPMGIRQEHEFVVVSPFRPSATLDHLLREKCAVVNYTDDVRIFAGCLTGRYDWPMIPVRNLACRRLAAALSHSELELVRVEDDPLRPRLFMREIERVTHAPFPGFNRAQAAVIEAAILVSRLHMLPMEKIDAELEYLAIGIGKTAGPAELEAWGWLMERVRAYQTAPG